MATLLFNIIGEAVLDTTMTSHLV